MLSELVALWESKTTTFLAESNDKATVHYKPTRSGSNVRLDEFHQESTNPASPSDIGITETETPTFDVYGKTHLDLYGTSLGGSEVDKSFEIGKVPSSDAVFTCLLSDVKISASGDPIKTRFDSATYVVLEKDGRRYSIDGIRFRGPSSAFVVDVYMTLTNKKDL